MSTTNIDDAEVMTELRAKQQQVWSSGDYNRIAALTVAVLTLTRAGLAAQAASAASTYTATAWAVTVVRGCG